MIAKNLVEQGSLDQDGGDSVWVDIGSGSSVLEVTVTLGTDMSRNSDGSSSVGDTGRERGHGSSLVFTSQSLLVVLSVDGQMLDVLALELLDRILDRGHTLAGRSHGLGRVVRVATSTVPVTLEGLGVERGFDTPLFSDSEQEESSHPEVVSHLNTLARTDLELPLSGHDLGVDTRDLDTGIQTSSLKSQR